MTRRVRTVFAGTPDFAVPSLKALLERPALEVVAVYTQPDRPAGRGRQLQASPVKRVAMAAGVPVEQPERVTPVEAQATFAAYAPDLLVVAAYGLMLPPAFIDPPITALNVHASLLPRWRGAAPIQRAIMAGDTQSGISIMRVVLKLDAGPVWLTRECPIDATTTGGELHDTLAALGALALDEAIERYLAGNIVEAPQDETGVTYAAKLGPADRIIDWQRSAREIDCQVRALAPAPGAQTRLGGLEVKVLAGHPRADGRGGPAGALLGHDDDGILVATTDGCYAITELQPAGKQRMSARAFRHGYGQHL